jgi:transcriptional regulator with XRE-family HTH domain
MGKVPKRPRRTLYLAAWFEAFGVESSDVVAIADAIGYSESYLRNIIQDRKHNPSIDLLLALSEFFGITVNDFYQPPLPKAVLRAMSTLPVQARQVLLDKK